MGIGSIFVIILKELISTDGIVDGTWLAANGCLGTETFILSEVVDWV